VPAGCRGWCDPAATINGANAGLAKDLARSKQASSHIVAVQGDRWPTSNVMERVVFVMKGAEVVKAISAQLADVSRTPRRKPTHDRVRRLRRGAYGEDKALPLGFAM